MKNAITRREFIKTAGKGLSLLAILSGGITFSLPDRAQGEMRFVNDLIHGEDQLKIVFLERNNEKKSDAFLIMYLSESGLDVTLHDGGLNDRQTYQALLNLREEILRMANVPSDTAKEYALAFRMVISHFHQDHTEGLYGLIARTKQKLHVTEAYFPPATALPRGIYSDAHNGDLKHRVKLEEALEKFQPEAQIRTLTFGETCLVPTDIGQIQLFAPVSDWGDEQKRMLFEDDYGYRKASSRPTSLPIAVVNANSMFMRVSLNERSFLFTGDVEKRIAARSDEPLDEMIAEYGDALRADVIKYPHHGQQRNAAAKVIREKLINDVPGRLCILTAQDAPEQAGRALAEVRLPWLGIEDGSLIFTVQNNETTLQVVRDATEFL